MNEVEAEAPGRVNLIGEHTDYQDGFVMPTAVPQRTRARLRRRADGCVHAVSAQQGMDPVEYTIGQETRAHNWGDYVRGLTWVLGERGVTIGGFDLSVDSDVPVGSGLSSSAALEIATLRAIRSAFDVRLSDVDIARVAHRAEVEFVGAPVGMMDQMVCSLGTEREALFLDTRSLGFERIPLPETLELVVIDSGVPHDHATGEYATRRRESEEAARQLGVKRLRDLGLADLARVAALPPPLNKRARHVITENDRVLLARDALRRGDVVRLGHLFNASHASLRDDYEVSAPDVDAIVEIAVAQSGVYGARMTGGGFGGAIVIAAAAGRGHEVGTHVVDVHFQRTSHRATVLIP